MIRDDLEAAGKLEKIEFLTIALTGGEAYVESYCTYGDHLKLWPIIMDTAEAALWEAYEAAKDDLLLVDQQGGADPMVVESWMGTGKIYPSTESDQATLLEAFDAHLQP